jgi:RHS repeat-associated protein
MATYRYSIDAAANPALVLTDRPLYGSSRLGSNRKAANLYNATGTVPATALQQVDLHYELTDHLGNVAAVVTGRLLPDFGAGTNQQAELVSAQGYEAFGALLPGRNYSSDAYRFAFQGQEKDNDIYGSVGTSYAFEYRMHDSRIGRFLSIDPLAFKYPWNSPYAFAENKVIQFIELEGLETATPPINVGPYTPDEMNPEAGGGSAPTPAPYGPLDLVLTGMKATWNFWSGDLKGNGSTGTYGGHTHMTDGPTTEKSIKTTRNVGTTDGDRLPGATAGSIGWHPTLPSKGDVDDVDDLVEEGAEFFQALANGLDKLAEAWNEATGGSSNANPVLINGNSSTVQQSAVQNSMPTGTPVATSPLNVPATLPDTMQAGQYFEFLIIGGDSSKLTPVPKGRGYEEYWPNNTSPSKRGL